MKKSGKLLTVLLAAAIAGGAAIPVSARVLTDQNLTKISNPDAGERQTDGLVPEGDRQTSYAWCMAARGQYVYIGTNKNIAGSVVNSLSAAFAEKGVSLETAWSIVDAISNGEIPHPTTTEGGQILRVNCLTNEIDVIYTAPAGTSFRMAIAHGDDLYFGSYAAGTGISEAQIGLGLSNDIFRIDPEDNVEKVFESFNGTSMRAACEYEGGLYFGGVDASEELKEGYEGCAKLAILTMDENDSSNWSRVADYRDFGVVYASDPAMSNAAASPIWDICSYKGDLYATLPGSYAGFSVFRGHPVRENEVANEYGWFWEEVVGYNNGKNPAGLGESEYRPNGNNMISVVATPVVFNDELYLFDFDHTIGATTNALSGMVSSMFGADVKASNYLAQMYNTLRHTQNLWKYNDETGIFEKVEAFSDAVRNTTVEYVWRAEEYNGNLYITTMDSAPLYNYVTRLTNGNFVDMTADEWKEQISYIVELAASLDSSLSDKIAETKAKLQSIAAELQALYDQLAENEDVQAFTAKLAELTKTLQETLVTVKEELANEEFVQVIVEQLQCAMMISADGAANIAAQIREYLLSHDLSHIIAPDLDVPLSTLSDEELSAYIDAMKENTNAFVESLKISIPELRPIDKEAIQAAVVQYVSNVIDKTVGQELLNAILNLKTAFNNRVDEQVAALKTKIADKVNEYLEKLPEDKRTKLEEFVQKDRFTGIKKIKELVDTELETFKSDINTIVTFYNDVPVSEIEAMCDSTIDFVVEKAFEALEAFNTSLQKYGLELTDEAMQSAKDHIQSEADSYKTKVSNRIDELALDREQSMSGNVSSKIQQKIAELDQKINVVYYKAKEMYDKIDWDGLKMYAYISDMVKNDTWGFDMVRTSDGENFEVVTNDGFGDKYNYGGRSMVATEYGLYIGTANPFYGAQLYRLSDSFNAEPTLESDEINLGEKATVNLSASDGVAPYRYTVMYKKSSASNWTLAARNTTEASVSFTPGAAVSYDVRVLSKDSTGSVVKKSLTLKVHKPLENNSRISPETITLGESIKLRAIAKGGDGNYEYKFSYKKASSEKWYVVKNYSDTVAVGLKPGSATTYDIVISVKDGTGTVIDQAFKVTVTK